MATYIIQTNINVYADFIGNYDFIICYHESRARRSDDINDGPENQPG